MLYLPELIKKYVVKGIEYNKIIPQITCLINKYKRNIEPDFYVFEKIINTLNINYIYDYDSNSTILLHEVWEFFYYTISDKLGYINNIKEIPNFKHFFEIITKMIIYSHVTKLLKVQKTKKETIHLREDYLMKLFTWLNKYPEINSLMKEYSQIVLTDVNKIIESLTKKN